MVARSWWEEGNGEMFTGYRGSVLQDEKVRGNFVDKCHPNKFTESEKGILEVGCRTINIPNTLTLLNHYLKMVRMVKFCYVFHHN